MVAKKLKAAERIKRRYLLIEASKDTAKDALLQGLGTLGWARAAPLFLESNKSIVLAVNRAELHNVRAALELSGESIRVPRVSGTLKGLGVVGNNKYRELRRL